MYLLLLNFNAAQLNFEITYHFINRLNILEKRYSDGTLRKER